MFVRVSCFFVLHCLHRLLVVLTGKCFPTSRSRTSSGIPHVSMLRTLGNEWHCNHIPCLFFFNKGSAVGRPSMLYSAQSAEMYSSKVVCSQHFLEDHFTSEYIHLNRVVVSTFCATSSHSHSAPNPRELIYSIQPMS
jgi:hypothetical protein